MIVDLILTSEFSNLVNNSQKQVKKINAENINTYKQNKEKINKLFSKIVSTIYEPLKDKTKAFVVGFKNHEEFSSKLTNMKIDINDKKLMELLIDFPEKLGKLQKSLEYFNNKKLFIIKDFTDINNANNLINNLELFYDLEHNKTPLLVNSHIKLDVFTEISNKSEINLVKEEHKYMRAIETIIKHGDNKDINFKFLTSPNLKFDLKSIQDIEMNEEGDLIKEQLINLANYGLAIKLENGFNSNDIYELKKANKYFTEISQEKSKTIITHKINQSSEISVKEASKILQKDIRNQVSLGNFVKILETNIKELDKKIIFNLKNNSNELQR